MIEGKRLSRLMGNPWSRRIMILAIIIIVMGIFQPKFFGIKNVNSILLAICIYGTMACGMLFVVLQGGMDLSVGSTAALCGCILSMYCINGEFSIQSFITGVALGLLAALVIGLVHGLLVSVFSLPSFIVTLATQYFIYGAVQLYTGGEYSYPTGGGVFGYIGSGRLFGAIPFPVFYFFIIIAVSAFLLKCTTFGRKLYANGGNPFAAKLVGIRPRLYTNIAYIICSLCAGTAGMLLVSMNAVAGSSTGRGYEGLALMAMVVGGINLAGGEGGVDGAVFGALLVGIITNVLTLLGVPSDYQKFSQGVIILAALALNEFTSRRSMSLGHIRPRISTNRTSP